MEKGHREGEVKRASRGSVCGLLLIDPEFHAGAKAITRSHPHGLRPAPGLSQDPGQFLHSCGHLPAFAGCQGPFWLPALQKWRMGSSEAPKRGL